MGKPAFFKGAIVGSLKSFRGLFVFIVGPPLPSLSPAISQGLRPGGFATHALSAVLLLSPSSPHFHPSPSDQPLHSHPYSTLSPGDAFPFGHHEGSNHTHMGSAHLTVPFPAGSVLLSGRVLSCLWSIITVYTLYM